MYKELEKKEKAISVIGLGYVGLPLALAFARKFKVIGFDINEQRVAMMRNGEDRKQERRREVSKTHCVVAIAGDTRADFDELYLYLKDRSAAQPLEELVGAGWFLTPLPIEEGL